MWRIRTCITRTVMRDWPAVLAGVPVRIITVHNVKDAERKRNRWLMRWLNRFTQRIIAVSHAVKESLVQAGGDPGLIQVITNGVELPPTVSLQQRKSARAALGLGETERVILMVARMIALKRHIDLLQALSAMPPEFADVRLVLVGDGPERAQLENTARTLGLGERVRFLGTRTDVEELLPAADIGVLCSEHEALGIALLENMGGRNACCCQPSGRHSRGYQQ